MHTPNEAANNVLAMELDEEVANRVKWIILQDPEIGMVIRRIVEIALMEHSFKNAPVVTTAGAPQSYPLYITNCSSSVTGGT